MDSVTYHGGRMPTFSSQIKMKQKISQLMFKKYIDVEYQLPVYNPKANFDWIKQKSGLPWLLLNINIPYQIILKELESIQSFLVSHRDSYGEHAGWKSFCIHGKSFDATREETHYNDSRPYIWTPEARQYLPKTVNYFCTQWPKVTFARVRAMLLEPGGYISVHSDYPDSKLTAINIAITQPNGCDFVMERHGAVPFTPGNAFWLDISNKHTVFNNSDQPRWHLIIHQNFDSPEFQKLVVNSYQILYNKHNETVHNTN
jgi:hypothetical protein